ncbi:MAG: methionyl-tRNA formyltransferase [bacterium]|nr:methionyl-tRNA formyltransferase [bacterium]
MPKIIFFGTSHWSRFYLEALQKNGWNIVNSVPRPDVGVMAYYRKILPKEALTIPKKGILNVHHSLLPRWRGPAPVKYAILEGDRKTGVSIILTSEKVDAGDILSQKEIEILPEDTYLSLERRLIEIGVPLLLETLPLYLKGKIQAQVQDESQATYSKIIKTEDGKIEWSRPVEEIHRQIRALNPEPGTFTFWEKKRLIIMEALSQKASHQIPSGKVLPENNGFKIATAGGFIIPVKIKLEGKKETTPSAFLKGYPKIIGIILAPAVEL